MRTPAPVRRADRLSARPAAREQAEQVALATWLTNWKPDVVWAHIPNGGARHMLVAKALKEAGTKAGVPDVLVFTPPPARPAACGLAIELKAPPAAGRAKGRVSPAQTAWLAALEGCGWICRVCYGAAEAIRTIEKMGY